VTTGYDPGLSVSHFRISGFQTTLIDVSLNHESLNLLIQCHVPAFQPTTRISSRPRISRVLTTLMFDFSILRVSETTTLRHVPSLTTDGPDAFKTINDYDPFGTINDCDLFGTINSCDLFGTINVCDLFG
jgi:hypothetical protein